MSGAEVPKREGSSELSCLPLIPERLGVLISLLAYFPPTGAGVEEAGPWLSDTTPARGSKGLSCGETWRALPGH